MFGLGKTSNSISQNITSRKPGGGDANLAHRNEQASAERPIRTSRRSTFGLADPGVSKLKSKLEDQRQLNAHTKHATSNLPSTGTLSNTGKRRPTVKDQLPVATKVPRRSERISAQMRKAEARSERSSKIYTAAERKRNTAASSTGVSKGRSRSTPRATSIVADSHRIKTRQCDSKGGAKARRQSRS